MSEDIFFIDPDPTFPCVVDLPRPGKSSVAVTFRFRHMDTDAYFDMLGESKKKGDSAVEFLARFVDGWEGGNINAPFSLEALGKLVKNYPKASKVIFRRFDAELIGALEKN